MKIIVDKMLFLTLPLLFSSHGLHFLLNLLLGAFVLSVG